jgi:hypothetical protein
MTGAWDTLRLEPLVMFSFFSLSFATKYLFTINYVYLITCDYVLQV